MEDFNTISSILRQPADLAGAALDAVARRDVRVPGDQRHREGLARSCSAHGNFREVKFATMLYSLGSAPPRAMTKVSIQFLAKNPSIDGPGIEIEYRPFR
jgi:hypothetical protein